MNGLHRVLMLLLALSGCASGSAITNEDVAPSTGVGTVSLPLITQSGGETYRLVGSFRIEGPQNVTLSTGLDEATSIQQTLRVGEYVLHLV